MADIIPVPLDILQRVRKYVAGEGPTQAAIGLMAANGSTRIITESGNNLGPGTNAASGSGFTVCVDGAIAYGAGYFIAASSEGNGTVRRGSINDAGQLVWTNAFKASGDEVRACSYCGGLFFVTSRQRRVDGTTTCYIAISSDGKRWTQIEYLGGGAFDCGTVTCKQTEDATIYCSVGVGDGDNPDYSVLYSATSSNGYSWSGGRTGNAFSPQIAPPVGYGSGAFVTGGFAFSIVGSGSSAHGTGKAQSNHSGNGAGWSASDMPIAGGTFDDASFCSGAVYVKPGDQSHFVAVANQSGNKQSTYALTSTNGVNFGVINEWDDDLAGLSIISTAIGAVVSI